MKFFSAFFCELILILMISRIKDISDIIKDFVAIGFIVEIDDYFAHNLKDFKIWETKIEKFNEEIKYEVPSDYEQKLWSYICCG